MSPARVRALQGDRCEASQGYLLELARTPSVRAANRRMLRELGTRAIPPHKLARIAEAASARYGWPLHVVEDAGHVSIEQPEAFRGALRAALGQHRR